MVERDDDHFDLDDDFVAESDEEVVATIQHLVETGRVHLVGNFCDRDVAKHED